MTRRKKPAARKRDPQADRTAVALWCANLMDFAAWVQQEFEQNPVVASAMTADERRQAAVAFDQLWSLLSMVRPRALNCPAKLTVVA